MTKKPTVQIGGLISTQRLGWNGKQHFICHKVFVSRHLRLKKRPVYVSLGMPEVGPSRGGEAGSPPILGPEGTALSSLTCVLSLGLSLGILSQKNPL